MRWALSPFILYARGYADGDDAYALQADRTPFSAINTVTLLGGDVAYISGALTSAPLALADLQDVAKQLNERFAVRWVLMERRSRLNVWTVQDAIDGKPPRRWTPPP